MSDAPAAHPSPLLLEQHAGGWLPWAADLCVEVHLEGCALCRATVAGHEELFANLVDSLPDAPMDPTALDSLIRKLEAIPVAPRPAFRNTLGDVPLPKALQHVDFTARRWLKPGLWISHLRQRRDDGWRAYILRAPAGMRLPTHGHDGPEYVCVLAGELVDGHTYRAGDFVENMEEDEHEVETLPHTSCACLIASKGAPRWSGAARVLNPLLDL